MNKLVHLVLFSVALAILAGCPPRGVGPTPPGPGNCDVPDLVGELPEVKQWDGSLPDLSEHRPSWVVIPTEMGAVYVAVDTLKRAIPYATHVPDVERVQFEGRLLIKLGLVIIGGVRAPCCRPNPPGIPPEVLRFAYETVMQQEQLKTDAIRNKVLVPEKFANPGEL